MFLFVHCLLQQLVSFTLLLELFFLQRNLGVSAQWITIAEFSMRVPGRCTTPSAAITGGSSGSSSTSFDSWTQQLQFDCGGVLQQQKQVLHQLRCIPLRHFHDGIVDCPDGSDEFCFPGYVKCGTYCVLPQYTAQCLVNPRCDNSPTSPSFCDVTKEKLCPVEGTVPCKGYGECVMRKWIEQGLTSCIDKSDEDSSYTSIFGINRGTSLHTPALQIFTTSWKLSGGFGSNVPSDTIVATMTTSNWLQEISSTLPPQSSSSKNGTGVDNDMFNAGTQDFNGTSETTEPAELSPTQFVFRIPDSNLNNNHGVESLSFGWGTVVPGDSKPSPEATGGFISQQQYNETRGRKENSATGIYINQKIYEIRNDSNRSSAYWFQTTTTKPNSADFGAGGTAIESPEPLLTYHPGARETASQTPTRSDNWLYEKLNSTRYAELFPSVKSAAASGSSSAQDRSQIQNNRNQLPSGGSDGGTKRTENVSGFGGPEQHGASAGAQVQTEYSGSLKTNDTTKAPDNTSLSPLAALGRLRNLAPNWQNGTTSISSRSSIPQQNTADGITVSPEGSQQITQPKPINAPNQQQQYTSNGLQTGTITTISTTTTLSPDQVACAHYEYEEAQRLVPDPWCSCPPGEMPSEETGQCRTTTVSTFGVNMQDMCAGMPIDPEQRPRLAILVLNRTHLPYRACVRRDGQPVMVQLDCSQCSNTEFEDAFKKNARDHYIPLRIEELSLGACLASSLNDCDPEHADCLVVGPRYRCRCHDGWNDTSAEIGKEEGRRCEQVILLAADGCIPFLGICLLWWFLLLGIILFLLIPFLCWAGYWFWKRCLKKEEQGNAPEDQGHLITAESGTAAVADPVPVVSSQTSNTRSDPATTGSTGRATSVGESIKSTPTNRSSKVVIDHSKTFRKQQTAKSLDTPARKAAEMSINAKQLKTRSAQSDEAITGPKAEQHKRTQELVDMFGTHASIVGSQASLLEKSHETTSKTSKDSVQTKHSAEKPTPADASTNAEMAAAMVGQTIIKNPEVPKANGNAMISNNGTALQSNNHKTTAEEDPQQETITNKMEKNVSQSSSEISLRTMWELFKQSAWKQSSRPSSIKSSTPSLDRLIDVFLCRTSNKIHPLDGADGTEFPLKPVQTVPDATTQSLGSTAGIAAATVQPFVPTAPAQVQTQVLEQKIVTETKTMTTTNVIPVVPLLPGEVPCSVDVAAPVATAAFNRSESVQTDDQQSIQSVSSSDAGAGAKDKPTLQHPDAADITAGHQIPVVVKHTAQGHDGKGIIATTTTTIVNSSDAELKKRTNAVYPAQNALRKTQSDHGGRLLMVPHEESRQKSPPTAEELREALKQVASMKPPTKRMTEKQREKLSASCEHLHMQIDSEGTDSNGGTSCRLVPRSRYEPRRKLSSISEKSAELATSGGEELGVAPSSVSCPTTTRISKDQKRLPSTLQKYRDGTYATRHRVFADLRAPLGGRSAKVKRQPEAQDTTAPSSRGSTATMKRSSNIGEGWSKADEQRALATRKRRKNLDSDTGVWHQRPISVVDARPPWDSSPLKEGELDRIAPLQPISPHHYQHRKWRSASHLDQARAYAAHADEGSHRRRQSDLNLHDTSTRVHALRTSHLMQLRARLWTTGGGGVQWTPNGTQDSSKPVKEQLWWGVH